MPKDTEKITVIPAVPVVPAEAPDGPKVLEFDLPKGVECDYYQVFPGNDKKILAWPKGYKLSLASRLQAEPQSGSDGTAIAGGSSLLTEKYPVPPLVIGKGAVYSLVLDANAKAVKDGKAISVRQAYNALSLLLRIQNLRKDWKLAQPLIEPFTALWVESK